MSNSGRKILVCIDLTKESINLIKNKIKLWNWIDVSEVIFCHVIQTRVYPEGMLLGAYNQENRHDEMKKVIEGVLLDLSEEVFDSMTENIPHYFVKCIFSFNKKKAVTEYILTHNIDEVVVGTSTKHGLMGLFTSSFGAYLMGHTQCDLRVLKPKFSLV
jgi:nucleotide-binding universal stress UspA family protein